MNIPHWVNDLDSTVYVDEQFAKIGRLLFWAQKFEGICKALNNLVQIYDNPKVLTDEEEFNELLAKLKKLNLYGHIRDTVKYFSTKDIGAILHTAREARNEIAHSLTLGLESTFGDQEQEKWLENRIKKLAREIVEGEFVCIVLSEKLTNSELPPISYVENNVKWIIVPQ